MEGIGNARLRINWLLLAELGPTTKVAAPLPRSQTPTADADPERAMDTPRDQTFSVATLATSNGQRGRR